MAMTTAMESGQFRERRADFVSQGLCCAGTLLTPEGVVSPPVVILGHGFAAERAFALPAFARRFAEAGFAAYYFDYRNFGDSEGQPRHWVSPRRHQQDWRAAVAHVRQLDDINPDQVFLWGSSYGGGHVLQIASEGLPVAGVIAQVPHVSGLATLRELSLLNIATATAAGLRDILGSALFRRPYYSPVVGRDGEFAAMSGEQSWCGYLSMVPDDSAWENKVLSRAFITLPFFSPITRAGRIGVPTMIVVGSDDTVTPPAAARKMAEHIPGAELQEFDSNHFQVYAGETFEQNITAQLQFLMRNIA